MVTSNLKHSAEGCDDFIDNNRHVGHDEAHEHGKENTRIFGGIFIACISDVGAQLFHIVRKHLKVHHSIIPAQYTDQPLVISESIGELNLASKRVRAAS